MKNTSTPQSAQDLLNSLIEDLFSICEKNHLSLRSDSKRMTTPEILWFDDQMETINHHYRGPIYFDAVQHYLLSSALGAYVPMEITKLEESMIVIYKGNIQLAAEQYLKSKLQITPNDSCYQKSKTQLEKDLAIISGLYHTSIWLLEHAQVQGGFSLGVKKERDQNRDYFRHNIALWLTSITLRNHSNLYTVLMTMISSERSTLQNFHTLNIQEDTTFSAITQCIQWKSDYLELIGALARDHCGQDMSTENLGMFNFWWRMSILVGDNRLPIDLKEEFKRIVKNFYPNFYFKLPFIQDGPNPACWN